MDKDKLLEKIKEYVDKKPEKKFIPNVTYIPPASQYLDGYDIQSLVDACLDMWFTEGEKTKEFERNLTHFYKNTIRNVVLTNSGSSANLLAVTTITDKVFGRRRAEVGDEIITVATGFPTTFNPILQNNLVPVIVDVDLESFVPDMDVIENAIVEGRTKGVVLAHPLGNPFDAETLREICNEYGIWMIEDSCDALGGTLNDNLLGSFGDVATLSFYPAHHITAGEGGACLIQSPMVNKVLESYRDWGRDCWCEPGKDNTCGLRFEHQLGELPFGYDHKYTYSRIGYNLKSTDLAAGLLISQLKKLPSFVEKRRHNWNTLYAGLEKFSKYFRFQKTIKGANPSWFGFAITVKETAPFSRNEFVKYLEAHKIGTRLMFGGNLLRQPAYIGVPVKIFQEPINSDLLMRDCLWIGCHPSMTDEMTSYIISTISEFINENIQR